MKWYEIKIDTDEEYSKIVSNFLHENGSNGILIEDNESIKLNEEYGEFILDEDRKEGKPGVVIKGYYNNYKEIIKTIEKKLDNKRITIEYSLIKDDWKEKWKEGFEKVNITKDILIKPSWDNNSYDEKIQIKIDPGMAFGTGTHETTSLCIKMLDKYLKPNYSVLDLGCGSGILSIVASKLNASKIHAIDIDPESIEASKENFIMNNVNNVELLEGNLKDIYKDKPDILVANILSGILIMLIKDIVNSMSKETIFISSGITTSKMDEVICEYVRNGLEIIDKKIDGNWVTLIAKKIKNN